MSDDLDLTNGQPWDMAAMDGNQPYRFYKSDPATDAMLDDLTIPKDLYGKPRDPLGNENLAGEGQIMDPQPGISMENEFRYKSPPKNLSGWPTGNKPPIPMGADFTKNWSLPDESQFGGVKNGSSTPSLDTNNEFAGKFAPKNLSDWPTTPQNWPVQPKNTGQSNAFSGDFSPAMLKDWTQPQPPKPERLAGSNGEFATQPQWGGTWGAPSQRELNQGEGFARNFSPQSMGDWPAQRQQSFENGLGTAPEDVPPQWSLTPEGKLTPGKFGNNEFENKFAPKSMGEWPTKGQLPLDVNLKSKPLPQELPITGFGILKSDDDGPGHNYSGNAHQPETSAMLDIDNRIVWRYLDSKTKNPNDATRNHEGIVYLNADKYPYVVAPQNFSSAFGGSLRAGDWAKINYPNGRFYWARIGDFGNNNEHGEASVRANADNGYHLIQDHRGNWSPSADGKTTLDYPISVQYYPGTHEYDYEHSEFNQRPITLQEGLFRPLDYK